MSTAFTRHINNIDESIKFTVEPEQNDKLPVLDLCVHLLEDSSTKITIYRKPTHTDQHLHFNSHHPLTHKLSVVCTLTKRAKQYVNRTEDKKTEVGPHSKSTEGKPLSRMGYGHSIT